MDEDDCGKIVGTCCPCHVLLTRCGNECLPGATTLPAAKSGQRNDLSAARGLTGIRFRSP